MKVLVFRFTAAFVIVIILESSASTLNRTVPLKRLELFLHARGFAPQYGQYNSIVHIGMAKAMLGFISCFLHRFHSAGLVLQKPLMQYKNTRGGRRAKALNGSGCGLYLASSSRATSE